MKTLYLDCSMGAAGDMLTAALLELLPEPEKFVQKLNSLGLPGTEYVLERASKCGITGAHMRVLVHGHAEEEHAHGHEHEHEHEHGHEHEHHHSGLHEIRHIVGHLDVPERVRRDILAVYGLIAGAESRVHGKPVDEIHFHEVGTLDAVADVTAVCLLMHMIAPERVCASAVHVGSGTVRCAHGILPVPAPATAYLLRGVPIYGGQIEAELCTPTGAALLKYFVSEFGPMPEMTVDAIGYGMGKRDLPRANCVRAMLGQTREADAAQIALELSCNVDDMSAEEISYAMERLFAAGAREVYTVPAGMKKSRPGTLLRVICTPEQREAILRALFRHTSTIGVRETETKRYVLERSGFTVKTPLGEIRGKRSTGYGVERIKYEYDDLARLARANNLTLGDVRKIAEQARKTEVHHL